MTSRTQLYLAVTYLVFYVVAIAIERHGLERGPMSPLERILTAPILWGLAVYGVQAGFREGSFSWIAPSDRPFFFFPPLFFVFLVCFFLFWWGMLFSFIKLLLPPPPPPPPPRLFFCYLY